MDLFSFFLHVTAPIFFELLYIELRNTKIKNLFCNPQQNATLSFNLLSLHHCGFCDPVLHLWILKLCITTDVSRPSGCRLDFCIDILHIKEIDQW